MGRFRSLLLDRRFFQKSFPRNHLFHVKTRTGNCIWKQHPEYRSPYRITDFRYYSVSRFSIKKIRFGKQVLVSEGYYKQKSVWSFTFDHTLLYFISSISGISSLNPSPTTSLDSTMIVNAFGSMVCTIFLIVYICLLLHAHITTSLFFLE